MTLTLLYENDEWVAPIVAEMEQQGVEYRLWHLANDAIDCSGTPDDSVYFNKLSASAHTRGHGVALGRGAALIHWLESHEKRVVNGLNALRLEVSKAAQHEALQQAGIPTPKTVVVENADDVPAAIEAFGTPCIVKHNCGGKGLGVQLVEDLASFALDATSVDGVYLVQQYVQSPDQTIVRMEFIGGEFYYATRVRTGGSFELCPAEACALEDGPRFAIIDGFDHALVAQCEAFLAANSIDVAGIEFITDEAGQAYVYDINVSTNYNPQAEKAAGKNGMEQLVNYFKSLGC